MAKRWLNRFALTLLLSLTAGCAGGIADVFRPDIYTVRSGDTLYSIAWRYQRDVDDLARWNNLDSPDTLFVGQRLRLTPPAEGERRVASTPSQQRESAPTAPARATGPPEEPARAVASGPPGDWQWPTDGEVIGRFNDGAVSGRGIDIRGEHGQPVRAAADGEVVYSGTGLPAYGPLIIIRHSSSYLSAYAHNDRLLVNEGDQVRAGDTIARMGRTPDGSQVLLHFEIRQNGDPVDPMKYLPRR